MTEFFLDVAAVVVGVAAYSWLRNKWRDSRYHSRRYSTDPWENW